MSTTSSDLLPSNVLAALVDAGLELDVLADGAELLEEAEDDPPDAFVLPLEPGPRSGTALLRRIRGEASLRAIPVVVVGADASEIDRVVAFELGADDFVAAPVSGRELGLRLRAILRRAPRSAARVVVDPDAHRVLVDKKPIDVSPLEFRLLSLLVASEGKVLTREDILDALWGVDATVEGRAVDAHVKRLRRKLGAAASHVATIRGVGYRFRPR